MLITTTLLPGTVRSTWQMLIYSGIDGYGQNYQTASKILDTLITEGLKNMVTKSSHTYTQTLVMIS